MAVLQALPPKDLRQRTAVRQMLEAQGFSIREDGSLVMPLGTVPKMTVPAELVPRCPKCGGPMTMNLRCDAAFVEDDGWHAAAARYQGFVEQHRKSAILYLELGVGLNTPGIIKYNFWQQAYENPNAVYACVNQGQVWAPRELEGRALCVEGDIGAVFNGIKKKQDGDCSWTSVNGT